MTNLRGVFVTGTDTGVGKTYIGAATIPLLAARGVPVIPRKPIESGCKIAGNKLIPADAAILHAAAGRPGRLEDVCPYRFRHALSPARAARLEGIQLTIAALEQVTRSGVDAENFLWVEGAGGFYSPLASDGLNADLAARLGLPVLLVAADRLGCINHVLLTVEAIHARNLDLRAVVLNQSIPDVAAAMDNAEDLRRGVECPVFTMEHGGTRNSTPAQSAPLVECLTCLHSCSERA